MEAQLSGSSATAGAVAAGVGEAGAKILSETVYNKSPTELTETEKQALIQVIKGVAGVAGGAAAGSDTTAGTLATVSAGMRVAESAVEFNYLKEKEALAFEDEMEDCKKNGVDCLPVIQKYLAISNRNSKELRKECTDGGAVCALKQEIIQADTNIALAKNDPLGRIYLGRYLQNDDVIKTVKFLNGHDIQFLNEKVSTIDRVLYTLSDPTSWPILVLGARNLALNNTKINWASTSIAMGVNAGVQYGTTGHIEMSDLISAGLVNQISAGKSYIGTANWNMAGGYYTAQIKGEDAHSGALLSRVASQGGYLVGKQFEDALQPIFNPVSKSYEWQYIGNGISKPVNFSIMPSNFGSFSGSNASELLNYELKKTEDK